MAHELEADYGNTRPAYFIRSDVIVLYELFFTAPALAGSCPAGRVARLEPAIGGCSPATEALPRTSPP